MDGRSFDALALFISLRHTPNIEKRRLPAHIPAIRMMKKLITLQNLLKVSNKEESICAALLLYIVNLLKIIALAT